MLNRLKQRNSEGFTIIEVLIVLAIAGLIMVVVFIAVPNLQRSQKNNALGSDANNIFTAIGNYASDNNGNIPTKLAVSGTTATIGDSAAGNTETTAVSGNFNNFVGGTNGILSGAQTAAAVKTAVGTVPGSFVLVTGASAVCDSNKANITGSGGSTRSYALVYVTYTNGDLKCIDSN